MKILILDNYDSFTYNIVSAVKELGKEIPYKSMSIFRNDKIDLEAVGGYDKIILSPGPGIPSEAGILLDVIKRYYKEKDILGICLGHQAIGEAFGGELENLDKVFHGVSSTVRRLKEDVLFRNIPEEFEVGRYHSWNVKSENFPDELEVTAVDESGYIMALRHKIYNVRGVQFHPESILTPLGKEMIRNFLES